MLVKKRNLSCIVAFALVLAIALSLIFCVSVSALTPYKKFSEAYKTSKYYSNIIDLELTGDQRSDIVRVALTQLGYHEGNGESDFHGGNSLGSKNFVEYNRLYGKLDNGEGNGVSYGYQWCAAFATWCARQAGIAEKHIPTEVSCIRLVNHFQNRGTYHTRASGYVPKSGDIIMFKSGSSGVSSNHTGVVQYVDGNTVYTIEGNESNQVSRKSYALSSTYIVGYGSPSLESNAQEAIDFNPASGRFQGTYVVSASELNLRAEKSASSKKLGSVERGDVYKVTEISGTWGKITAGNVTAWVSMNYMQLLTPDKYTVSYDSNGGELASEISDSAYYGRSTKVTDAVPTRTDYTFLGWSENKNATEPTYSAGESINPTGDVTLYAAWKFNGYKVSFYDHNGALISSGLYQSGAGVTPPRVSSRAEYTFLGWSESKYATGATYADGSVISARKHVNLYAVWVFDGYEMSFYDHNGNLISSEKYQYGESVTPPSLSARADYSLLGWSENKDASSATYTAGNNIIAKKHIKLYAIWQFDGYKVFFYNESGEIISSARYQSGESVTPPEVTPQEDYTFLGWSENMGDTNATYSASDTISVEDHITLYEVWSFDGFKISFYDHDGTLIQSERYQSGETVTPPTPPTRPSDANFDYVFEAWDKEIEAANAHCDYTAVYKVIPIVEIPDDEEDPDKNEDPEDEKTPEDEKVPEDEKAPEGNEGTNNEQNPEDKDPEKEPEQESGNDPKGDLPAKDDEEPAVPEQDGNGTVKYDKDKKSDDVIKVAAAVGALTLIVGAAVFLITKKR